MPTLVAVRPFRSGSERDSEVKALLAHVEEVAPGMPDDEVPEEVWSAWMALDKVQSIIVGWASREGDHRRAGDDEALAAVKAILARPDVTALVGNHRGEFERLITLLYERLR
jgi:hypothetical protein